VDHIEELKRSRFEVATPDTATIIEPAAKVVKVATAIDHVKNNRIEYLVLLVLSHMLGLTSVFIDKASGVCGV